MKLDNLMRGALLAGSSLALVATQPVLAQEFPQGGTLRIGISQMAPSPDPVVTTFGVNWAPGLTRAGRPSPCWQTASNIAKTAPPSP
jgi:hypothetical protein